MGIAKFYSWLRNKNYRGALIRQIPQLVSSFSFDLNGLIHNVAQIVYAYGEGENEDRKKLIAKMDPRDLEAEFHHTFASKLSAVITSVQPRDTLVLAVDGVAPQAKIAQQRQRLFRAAFDSTGTSIFNSSSITPGTEFMKRLDNYIQRWIIASKNTLPPKVIYSSHLVKNEGEHKIFEMFRNGSVVGDSAHVVYGMDADLVMLSMLSPLDRIYLMREDLRDVIDIDNLKTGIQEEMEYSRLDDTRLESEINTSIPDFVVMIYLIGNDFLPHLPTLNEMEEAIETMIRIYKMTGVSLTNGVDIDWTGFSKFLSALALEEPRLLELESIKEVKYPSKMMEMATQKSQTVGTGVPMGGIQRTSRFDPLIFRGAWYGNAFDLRKNQDVFSKLMPDYKFGATNAKIVEMVKLYLTGISWVFRYYNLGNKAINDEYVFRYLYAPLISDIAMVAKQFIVNKEDYEFNENALDINPVHQLLAVLPLKSRDILPIEVKHLMDKESPIADLYPESAILDRSGYNTDWQGTLLINFADMKRIINAVEQTCIFTPDRIKEFSPVLTVVLIRDPSTIEMDERTRKFKSYLTTNTSGRGRGRGRGSSTQSYSGRGTTSRGYESQSYSGRGTAPREYQPSGRGRGRGRGQRTESQGYGSQGYQKQYTPREQKEEKLPTIPASVKYSPSIFVPTSAPVPVTISKSKVAMPIQKFEL